MCRSACIGAHNSLDWVVCRTSRASAPIGKLLIGEACCKQQPSRSSRELAFSSAPISDNYLVLIAT